MLHVCICMCMSCLSVFWKEQLSDRWREWPVFWQIEREMLLKPRFSLIGRICAVCACRGVILPCLHSPQLVHQNRQAILNQFAATAPVGMNMRSGMQQQITPQVNFSSSGRAAWRDARAVNRCSRNSSLLVLLFLEPLLKAKALCFVLLCLLLFRDTGWSGRTLHHDQPQHQHFLGWFSLKVLVYRPKVINFTLKNNWMVASEMAQWAKTPAS